MCIVVMCEEPFDKVAKSLNDLNIGYLKYSSGMDMKDVPLSTLKTPAQSESDSDYEPEEKPKKKTKKADKDEKSGDRKAKKKAKKKLKEASTSEDESDS
jgi:hypothetical protein